MLCVYIAASLGVRVRVRVSVFFISFVCEKKK
jgi:hypothetical protein